MDIVDGIGQLAQVNRIGRLFALTQIGNLGVGHIQSAFGGDFAGKLGRIGSIDADGGLVLVQHNVFTRFQRDGRTVGNFFQRVVVGFAVGAAGFSRIQLERLVRGVVDG